MFFPPPFFCCTSCQDSPTPAPIQAHFLRGLIVHLRSPLGLGWLLMWRTLCKGIHVAWPKFVETQTHTHTHTLIAHGLSCPYTQALPPSITDRPLVVDCWLQLLPISRLLLVKFFPISPLIKSLFFQTFLFRILSVWLRQRTF